MTGVAYSQICSRNGTPKPMSRYLTAAPDSQSAIESASSTARRRKKGRNTICQLGARWYHANRPRRTANESTRSTRGAVTTAIGAYRRGKYALEISDPFEATLDTPLPVADVKYVQMSTPGKTNSGYGTPFPGLMPTRLPKMTENRT